jgi:hypothetical protein
MVRCEKRALTAVSWFFMRTKMDILKTIGLDPQWATKESLAHFQKNVDETKLTDAQRAKICETKTIHHCRKFVKVKYEINPQRTPEEQAKKDAEQAEIKKKNETTMPTTSMVSVWLKMVSLNETNN